MVGHEDDELADSSAWVASCWVLTLLGNALYMLLLCLEIRLF